jgi:hypothetical protein
VLVVDMLSSFRVGGSQRGPDEHVEIATTVPYYPGAEGVSRTLEMGCRWITRSKHRDSTMGP